MKRSAKTFWQDKCVVITGSSRGIGRETARFLGGAGAKVVLNGRNRERLEETTRELRDEGINALGRAGDVTSTEDMDALMSLAREGYGGVDVLINNAGSSMRGPFAELTEDLARRMTEVNILGAVVPTVAALEALLERRGSVYFISSAAGLRGFPNVSIYSATKMALTGLSESLGAELRGRGVTVGICYLGFTENDPDKEIYNARGELITVKRSWQHTQVEAAEAIGEAVRRGKRRAVFTGQGKLLAAAQRLSPRLVDWAVQRAAVHK